MPTKTPPNSPLNWLWQSRGGSWLVTTTSALACVMGVWVRLPGMVLADLTPNWPLVWVVCWSVNRTPLQGAIAGLVMGFLHDSLTQSRPTHALGLAIVGILTARLQKSRYVREDFISVALIVFGMAVIAETLMALQWTLLLGWNDAGQLASRTVELIWLNYQQIALSSAVLSSLWAPAVYLPLRLWWQREGNGEGDTGPS